MRSLISILFDNNYNVMIFFLFLGVLAAEIYLLKYPEILGDTVVRHIKEYILIIAVVFGVMMVVRSDTNWENDAQLFETSLEPAESTCLIGVFERGCPEGFFNEFEVAYNTIQYCHYFNGKEIVVFDNVKTRDDVIAHLQLYASKYPISIEYDRDDLPTEADMEEVCQKTKRLKKDGRLFLMDKSWNTSKTIVCIEVGEQVYFLPDELYESLLNDTAEQYYLDAEDLKSDKIAYVEKACGESDIFQILLAFVIFVIGYFVCRSVFDEKVVLVAFMGFPVGLAIVCSAFMACLMLGIPVRRLTILGVFAIILVVAMILRKKKRGEIYNRQDSFVYIVAFLVIWLFTYLKIFNMRGDSCEKILYGVYMAEYYRNRNQIASFYPFGLLEPIMHCIAWKLKSDWFYTMYPLSVVSCLGVLVSSNYYLASVQSKKKSIFLSIIVLTFLLSNYDYLIYANWVFSNSIVGCEILLIIVSILTAIKWKNKITFIVLPAAFTIVLARVEGSIYIALIFVLACGVNAYRPLARADVVSVGISIILLQVFLFCFYYGYDDRYYIFWSVEKGVVCAACAILMILVWLFLQSDWGVKKIIIKNYYLICIISCVLLAMICEVVGCTDVTKVTLGHFATSNNSNSAGIWSFFVLLLPILCTQRRKDNGFLLTLVISYLAMVFAILCFREGTNLHTGESDSSRRMISQIMPTAMFSIVYIISQIEEKNDGGMGS